MMGAYLVALAVIMALSALLVMWCHYDDGLFGKIALIGCFFGAGVPLWEIVSGIEYKLLPSTVLLTCAMALFLLRHVFRFIRWKFRGDYSWARLTESIK